MKKLPIILCLLFGIASCNNPRQNDNGALDSALPVSETPPATTSGGTIDTTLISDSTRK